MKQFLSLLLIFIILGLHFSFAEEDFVLSDIILPSNTVSTSSPDEQQANTAILLANKQTVISGSGAAFKNDCLTISESGTYYLSGNLDGTITVDSPDEDKVVLIFDGVSVKSRDQSALLVLNAGKNLTLSLVPGSVNTLETTFITDVLSEDGAYDAALFSKSDLKFKGSGSLYILCEGGKGVNCRDDVTIQSVSLFIKASDDGLRGKDSVTITSGALRISAGADGLRSSNDENEGKGFIDITGGVLQIDATGDAIQSYGMLTITGGEISCITGGGSADAIKTRNDMFDRGGKPHGRPGWDMDRPSSSGEQENTVSAKGLKSDTSIILSSGIIHADCMDDALHASQDITITGGEMLLLSGDDGIHADHALSLQGGSILIKESYEGLEAADLQISGGETRLYASDDGLNAAGGDLDHTERDGFGGSRGGFGGMHSTSSGSLTMSGGYVLVNSEGDGIDVNGEARITGGFMVVYGPVNGANSALDYDRSFTVSGGTLLATGSAGMAQSVTADGIASVLAFRCSIPVNIMVHIESEAGDNIITFSSPKSYSCVVLASDQLSSNTNYHVYAEGTYSKEAVDGIYADGDYVPGTHLGTLTI